MTVEPVSVPLDINQQWPLFNDPRKEGDDHIRNTKKALRLMARAMGGSRAVTPLVDTDLSVSAGLTYVQPEGTGTSGTITTITPMEGTGYGPLHSGAVIMIKPAAEIQPITVQHDSVVGNQNTVVLATGQDYVMDKAGDAFVLWYSGDNWIELCRSMPAGRYQGGLNLAIPEATLTLGGIGDDQNPPVMVGRGALGELFLNAASDAAGDNPASIGISPNPDFNSTANIFLFRDTRTWEMKLLFGDGSGDPANICGFIQPTDYNSIKIGDCQIELDGTYSKPLTLRNTYLWEDNAGRIRYKKGGAKPTSDTAGTLLQSVPIATGNALGAPIDFTMPASGFTGFRFELQDVGSGSSTANLVVLISTDGTNFITSGFEVAGSTLLKNGTIAYHNTAPTGLPLLAAPNTLPGFGGMSGNAWLENGMLLWHLTGTVKNGATTYHSVSQGAGSGVGLPVKIRFTVSTGSLDYGTIYLRGYAI